VNKQTTIRAVARKTGHTYYEVQTMLESLIDVWAEALAEGDYIAIQDFLTIKVTEIKTHRRGKLQNHKSDTPMRSKAYRVDVRLGENLRKLIRTKKL
jgi:nucleoid DNA-binding protein